MDYQKSLSDFKEFLYDEEKSKITIQKYVRDVRHFLAFIDNREITKALTIAYKMELQKNYAVTSANSMIAAVNSFLRFLNLDSCLVKQFKIQRQAYCPDEKELTKGEYIRLVNAAKRNGNRRLELMIETICVTGIRVSELQYITLDAVNRGAASVNCKGKTRIIFIPAPLQKSLLCYIQEKHIRSGAVFVTKNGNPINRCNIWREMKGICERAEVEPDKVFPHNLRHLFARTFYEIDKDIVKLADILGHSDINTTKIYTAATCKEYRRKIEQMKLIV